MRDRKTIVVVFLFAFFCPWFFCPPISLATAQTTLLLTTNLDAPFCYVHGGARRWPVLSQSLPDGVAVELTARAANEILGRGPALELPGLRVSLSRDGWLEIISDRAVQPLSFELEVAVGKVESQRLTVRAAPPPRPISYVSDFGDDLIHLFLDRTTNRWRPIAKPDFDPWFRRLQAHGVSRLIVWQTPFPYMADRKNYPPADWQRYESQARAIIENPELGAALEKRSGFAAWNWVRQLMALRLMPQFGDMVTRSAAEHGIALTASFRPFEIALSKYYYVPVFDERGEFLWNFHPLASPAVNYHADEVGFAHYRTVLAAMGRPDCGRLHTIEVRASTNAAAFVSRFAARRDNLQIVAAKFPPLQADSFVLVRTKDGGFRLRPFHEIQSRAEARCLPLRDFRVEHDGGGTARITNLKIPADCHYLILSNPSRATESLDLPPDEPATLLAKEGNQLRRENFHWVAPAADAAAKKTRMAGITAEGEFYTDFYVVEANGQYWWHGPKRRPLRDDALVIDLGEPWSVEMVDFNQPAARRYVVNELRTILGYPAFDEIFINTRSHTQLGATFADGKDGVKARASYRAAKQSCTHLGIDHAYAPRTAAKLKLLRDCPVEKITTWQPGEWKDTCQQPDSPYPWRYARNHEVAAGVRRLLQDLERAFPKTRIRVVMPERAAATERVKAALDTMPKPGGGIYGRDYYRYLWASINHIPAIGEGMAMLDLSGLRVEPVFLGIRQLPDVEPFKLYLRECIADMADNHGSSFRGPRSFFYEGHETLRTTDPAVGRRGREEIIRHLLSQRGEINEVILYESATWLTALPLSDPNLCGHGFLDCCTEVLGR